MENVTMHLLFEQFPSEQDIMALTSDMTHQHYCTHDIEAIIDQMDEDVVWFGAAEDEFAEGLETVAGIFRQFRGQVPKCNITDEEYRVIQLSEDTYLCAGRLWIETDASTMIALRVHQRVSMVFRWREGQLRCCHIHISNPYGEMAEGDVGFPVKLAQQSYQYLMERLKAQEEASALQTEELIRMSYEDALTGVYNRNKYNELIQAAPDLWRKRLGVAYFDLNGLKEVNDARGHSAGDELLQRTAEWLREVFDDRVYRIGGDEFVVVDTTRKKDEFWSAVYAVQRAMAKDGISCSVGVSWSDTELSLKERFEEADRRMYEEKRRFYSRRENDRRRRRDD